MAMNKVPTDGDVSTRNFTQELLDILLSKFECQIQASTSVVHTRTYLEVQLPEDTFMIQIDRETNNRPTGV